MIHFLMTLSFALFAVAFWSTGKLWGKLLGGICVSGVFIGIMSTCVF